MSRCSSRETTSQRPMSAARERLREPAFQKTQIMKQLVSSIAPLHDAEARLKALGVELVAVPTDPKDAPLPAHLVDGANYLFVELPPSNIREMKSLELVQPETVTRPSAPVVMQPFPGASSRLPPR